MEEWKDSIGQVVMVHEPSVCKAGPCPIHFPSPHHMIAWPQVWRNDRHIMERICPHDIGHPDPDCKHAQQDSTHGCDGCCRVQPRTVAIKRWDMYICDCAIGQHIEHVEDATGNYVSYDDHMKALADERRTALEKVAARIIDEHRMGDRDAWLDLARLIRAKTLDTEHQS